VHDENKSTTPSDNLICHFLGPKSS
jgi:hypothetical protein